MKQGLVLGLSLRARERERPEADCGPSRRGALPHDRREARGGRMIPFLGAGANLCDRGERGVGAGRPVPAERRRAGASTSPSAAGIRCPRSSTSCASRSTSTPREARTSSTSTCARCSTPTTAPTSLHRLLARVARALWAGGPAAASRGDDELRRPGRAGACRGRLECDVVWYEAKQKPRRRAASCTGRRAAKPKRDRAPEQVHGPAASCSSGRRS